MNLNISPSLFDALIRESSTFREFVFDQMTNANKKIDVAVHQEKAITQAIDAIKCAPDKIQAIKNLRTNIKGIENVRLIANYFDVKYKHIYDKDEKERKDYGACMLGLADAKEIVDKLFY